MGRRGLLITSLGLLAAASSAGADVGDDADDCWSRCGSYCERDAARKLVCPPRCTTDSDCATDRMCVGDNFLVDHQPPGRHCVRSECSGAGADRECRNGGTCAPWLTRDRVVYRCTRHVGSLTVGQMCGGNDAGMGLCAQGLVCNGGICVPTRCRDNGRCPKGTTCQKLGHGLRQCLPHCDGDRDCPADQACLAPQPSQPSLRRCLPAAARQTCLTAGCPQGQRCYAESSQPWDAVAACLTPCRDDAGCGAEQACVAITADESVCRPRCNPRVRGGCPAGYGCQVRGTTAFCGFNSFGSSMRHFGVDPKRPPPSPRP